MRVASCACEVQKQTFESSKPKDIPLEKTSNASDFSGVPKSDKEFN